MSSKKQSSLFSFFQKTTKTDAAEPEPSSPAPKPAVAVKEEKLLVAKDNINQSRSSKRGKAVIDSDSDCSPLKAAFTTPKNKRRRAIVSSDEEEDNSISPGQENKTPPESVSQNVTPLSKKPLGRLAVRTPTNSTLNSSRIGTPSSSIRTEMAGSFIKSFRKDDSDNEMNTTIGTLDGTIYQVDEKRVEVTVQNNEKQSLGTSEGLDLDDAPALLHDSFEFLKPYKIKDAKMHKMDDPEYDPTTLHVPPDFLREQTPGHRQWWTIKAMNFDTVLLFKVGKFYELYHMDAVVAVNHLSLTYMRGNYAHAGFPESAYARFADQLVSRGFKVARVEQTETPQQLDERLKKASSVTKTDKVVRRELCRVTTCGTRTYGVLDSTDGAGGTGDSSARQLLALKENIIDSRCLYGVCLVDTAVGRFTLSQFEDDTYRSKLRTLLANFQPVQVLLERGRLSVLTKNIVDSMLSSASKEVLASKSQFLTAEATVALLSKEDYLGGSSGEWPEALRGCLDPDSLVPRASDSFEQVLCSLGAVVGYLKRCLVDVEMVTMRSFEFYDDGASPLSQGKNGEDLWHGKHLVLDGVTLENLNIVPVEVKPTASKSRDISGAGYSLFNVVNKCSTPFGRRLLREWMCKPTCDPRSLRSRQDSIEWLLGEGNGWAGDAEGILKQLPDLSRLLQKVHTLGLKYRAEKHPDSRAVMFEMDRYNKRKIKDLLITLSGFEQARAIILKYDEVRMNGDSVALLDSLIGVDSVPDIVDDLRHFKSSFNHKEAEEKGIIVPKPGMDKEYDNAVDSVEGAEKALNEYRIRIGKQLQCKATFWGTGRNRYQLEIPDSIDVSKKFDLSSKKKGFARYYTDELRQLIDELGAAESERDKLRADATRRVFADFDSRKIKWEAIVTCMATVDVLCSLARFAQTCGLEMCRPEFVFDSSEPFLDVVQGAHPCLAAKGILSFRGNGADSSTTSYIPNDTKLGAERPLTMLLTGPNMGGKSTLMRQTAVLTILAHMGSLVPAQSMRLTPVDRIFTRIGANDRIMAGQSTFFVELLETKVMLRDATMHSLVLVDELGRGTSTFDGTAIASAVLSEIADTIACRALFSTHYHSLCSRVAENPRISNAHMACMVENENEEDPTEETVTFLYRLVDGVCPKSYGFYAAKLAGIRENVVREAYAASQRLGNRIGPRSSTSMSSRLAPLRDVARNGDLEQLTRMVAAL